MYLSLLAKNRGRADLRGGLKKIFNGGRMLTLSIIQEKYGLFQEYADVLIAEAEKELEGSIDLWQFTSLINANYSIEEKIEIIETLWRIVYVDGKMDQYEHYLMNKLKNLLRVSHNQLIDAKLKVKHSSQK